MKTERAKELFIAYIGSRFYMSRDGVEAEYLSSAVSSETEKQWMAELTQQKLADLAMAGNWKTVHFFNHHGDTEHLEQLMAADPKGAMWERCVFLEEMVAYVSRLSAPATALKRAALKKIVAGSAALLSEAGASAMEQRIRSVLDAATSLGNSTG